MGEHFRVRKTAFTAETPPASEVLADGCTKNGSCAMGAEATQVVEVETPVRHLAIRSVYRHAALGVRQPPAVSMVLPPIALPFGTVFRLGTLM